MGGTVRDAAQEKLGQAGEKVSEYCEQEQDTVHGIACDCEQFLRQRPLRSVLIAAGVGWLLGRFWNRRWRGDERMALPDSVYGRRVA
jgi:ElaB/YqjD/DUF883 family membrane-anchored ribosome-binding protein